MSCEETKEFLNKYWYICKKIIFLNEQLVRLREVEQSAKIQQLSDMPKGSARARDLSDVLARFERLQDKIDDKIVESLKIRAEIENVIADVEDPVEQFVLRKRYIEFKPWKVIASDIKYSIPNTKRIHRKAIEKLQLKTP